MKTIQELALYYECVKCMLLLEVALAMKKPPVIHEDCTTAKDTHPDTILCEQLEDYASIYFYEQCDRYTQNLLSSCEWYITTNASALILVIACPDAIINWRVLKNLVQIGSWLEQLASGAKIRVCPPLGMGTPLEIRVDELSIYQDWFAGESDNFFPPTGMFS